MKLLGSALSPYASRVLIAARFKGLDLPMESPEGDVGRARLLGLSPIGKIPVLVDGSLILPESDVILAWLEDRYPEPSLYPGDAAQRANVRLLGRLLDTYSAPSFGPFVENSDAVAIATARQRIDQALSYIEHFRLDGDFASGSAFSAADCALIPLFHILEVLDGGFSTLELVRKHTGLQRWWEATRSSEAAQTAIDAMDEAIAKMFQDRSA